MIKIVAYTKTVVFSVFLTIISNLLVGQNNITSKIRILRGSNVGFNFNSYNRIQNGITYNDFTQLQLYFNDTVAGGIPNPTSQGWQLTVRALQPNISGSMTTSTLPLESIKITIKKNGINYGPYDLGATELLLIDGPDATLNDNVEVSYSCGTDSNPNYNMINKVPDYYVVDIEFTLKPQ